MVRAADCRCVISIVISRSLVRLRVSGACFGFGGQHKVNSNRGDMYITNGTNLQFSFGFERRA